MRTKINFSKKRGSSGVTEDVLIDWSKLITGFCLGLLYAILLAHWGFFNLIHLLAGFLAIAFFGGVISAVIRIFRNFFLENFDFLRFLMVIAWIVWFVLLLVYSPFPAFSGRDEGSYANAAVYLARFHSLEFQLPLLKIFNGEGLSHQLLNFPGFVATSQGMASQFSPAYFVLLGVFALLTKALGVFSLVNGLLVLGGVIAFYLLIRLFAPRWFALAGVVALIFNFVFIWFPRFTFSENLAFMLFLNLLLLLNLFKKTGNPVHIYPIIGILTLFPLVRPEGWWLLVASLILLGYWYLKGQIKLERIYLFKSGFVMFLGFLFSAYITLRQFPIYKRLLRDWIKWPATETSYANLINGSPTPADAGKILAALFPSGEKMVYYLQVEWRYGILFFGLTALAALTFFFWDKKRKFLNPDMRGIVGNAALLGFPFFAAFISPQVSADHPWMLRRFFFVVVPCGILAALILIKTWMNKKPQIVRPYLAGLLLAAMLVPTLPATAYFLTVATDEGREAVLKQLGASFDNDSFIFLNRESSGDGWHMWAEPLSSVYGKNAVYVYSPDNLVNSRDLIRKRFSEGKKNYVILQENTFNFEHELEKYFDLAQEKEIDFNNLQLAPGGSPRNPDFPPLLNQSYKIKIYSLIPK